MGSIADEMGGMEDLENQNNVDDSEFEDFDMSSGGSTGSLGGGLFADTSYKPLSDYESWDTLLDKRRLPRGLDVLTGEKLNTVLVDILIGTAAYLKEISEQTSDQKEESESSGNSPFPVEDGETIQ